MATATTMWEDFAILEPTKPAFNKKGEKVQWKVQRNGAGQWRCYCPGFIFSGKGGAVRTCKHIRRCQQELAEETGQSYVMPPLAKAVQASKPTPAHPQFASAVTICTAMLDEARVTVHPAQFASMCQVLASKLAAFVPAKVPVAPVKAQTVTVGVRRILFDD